MKIIVKVKEENYVPSYVQVRSKISSFIYTADIEDSMLESLKSDPKIVSVSVSENVPLIKQV